MTWSEAEEIYSVGDADDWLNDLELAGAGNGLHAATGWYTDSAMYISWTLDGGETWSTPTNVDPDGTDPELYWSADGSTLFVTYQVEDEEPHRAAVMVGTVEGSSVSMGAPRVFDACSDWSDCDPEGAVSADGSTLLTTWINADDGISVAESDDGGTTWNTTVIAAGPSDPDDPEGQDPYAAMSADGTSAIVAWEWGDDEDEVVYVAHRDVGDWSDPLPVGPDEAGADSDDPRVVMSEDGRRVAVAYEYEPDSEGSEGERVEIALSEDGGATWSSPVSISGSEAFDADDPAVAMSDDGMTIVTAFERDASEIAHFTFRIGVVASHDGGQTWTSPHWVSAGNLSSRDPGIAISADGIRVMVAWEAVHPGSWSSQVARSDDGGTSWGAPVSVSRLHADDIERSHVILSDDGRTSISAWYLDQSAEDETIEAVEAARTYMPLRCEAANGHPFIDVSPASYLGSSVTSQSTFPVGNHVDCLYRLGVTTGTSETTFSPAAFVTREQMAAFLARLHGEFTGETCTGAQPFGDVAATSFAYDAVGCIAELGVTTGTSLSTFSPAAFVTREQMAAFLARMWRLVA